MTNVNNTPKTEEPNEAEKPSLVLCIGSGTYPVFLQFSTKSSISLAIIMTAAAAWLFFCTSFSGGNAVIVILTATALFWLPELAGILLAGLTLLQRKIADTLLV